MQGASPDDNFRCMESILEFAAHGRNVPGPIIQVVDARAILQGLEAQLEAKGHTWADVGLLLVANSKLVTSQRGQGDSDQNLLHALMKFCAEREWSPPLMGATTHSMFYADGDEAISEIADGLLIVAVMSAVLAEIPVAVELTSHDADRRLAGRNAIQTAIQIFSDAMESEYGVILPPHDVFGQSTGILLTTGSGHVEKKFVEFKDCYAIGQELLDAFGDVLVVGGCATNRSAAQLQCLYYSVDLSPAERIYRFTYSHGAVFALLPYLRASVDPKHPFVLDDRAEKLDIKFHEGPESRYAKDRFFVISEINGKEPIDFWTDYWDLSREELLEMERDHTAIPIEPRTYSHTIVSSLSSTDKNAWPNVPIWFESVNGAVMLRLVRAEAKDSNYFLMSLPDDALRRNAESIVEFFDHNVGRAGSVLSFLCESRKYLLNQQGSNIEADVVLSSMPQASTKIGIYLNGEYSLGHRRSIGYHNFSQITAVLPNRSVKELPLEIAWARMTRADKLRELQRLVIDLELDPTTEHEVRKELTALADATVPVEQQRSIWMKIVRLAPGLFRSSGAQQIIVSLVTAELKRELDLN